MYFWDVYTDHLLKAESGVARFTLLLVSLSEEPRQALWALDALSLGPGGLTLPCVFEDAIPLGVISAKCGV